MATTEALSRFEFDRIYSLRSPYGAHGPGEAKLAKMPVVTVSLVVPKGSANFSSFPQDLNVAFSEEEFSRAREGFILPDFMRPR